MKPMNLLAISVAFLLPVAATAADSNEAKSKLSETGTVANPEATSPGQRVICRKEEVVGSRLKAKKVCKTQAQWEYEQKEQRQTVEKGQQQRTLSNSG